MLAQLSMHASNCAVPCMAYQVHMRIIFAICQVAFCTLLGFAACCPYAVFAYAYILSCCCPLCSSTLSTPSMSSMFWSGMASKCATLWCRVTTEGDQRGHCTPPMHSLHPRPPFPSISAPPCSGMQVCNLLFCSGFFAYCTLVLLLVR